MKVKNRGRKMGASGNEARKGKVKNVKVKKEGKRRWLGKERKGGGRWRGEREVKEILEEDG